MRFDRIFALALTGVLVFPPSPAEACAIATVSQSGNLGADAQRIFVAARSEATDVVVQVTVPSTSEAYGILIPVPVRPTLDSIPVDSAELDDLDEKTQVRVVDNTGQDDGGGIGCGSADRAGALQNSTMVIDTAEIGPLTAVVLTTSSASDLTDWLAAHNFVIPSGKQELIDRYSVPGQYFIAAKRNDRVVDNSATSLGLHFSLPGRQLGIPLPIAQLGSAAQVAFTIFVVAPEAMGATGPYARLKLEDLNRETVRTAQYRSAIDEAVSAKSGRAFVEEGVYEASVLQGRLATFNPIGAKISRLSSVTNPGALTENLMLGPTNETPSSSLDVTADEDGGGCRAAGGLASPLAYLVLFFALIRRAKATSQSPSASASRAR